MLRRKTRTRIRSRACQREGKNGRAGLPGRGPIPPDHSRYCSTGPSSESACPNLDLLPGVPHVMKKEYMVAEAESYNNIHEGVFCCEVGREHGWSLTSFGLSHSKLTAGTILLLGRCAVYIRKTCRTSLEHFMSYVVLYMAIVDPRFGPCHEKKTHPSSLNESRQSQPVGGVSHHHGHH